MIKKFAALALALFAVASAGAQQANPNVSRLLTVQLNLNQTVTPTYCAPGAAISTSYRVAAANSTTVTAVTGTPFAGLGVGDVLHIIEGSTDIRRAITVWTSATSVVISGAAVTLTSGMIQSDSFRVTCGTTSAFGAFSVNGFTRFAIQVDIDQQVNTGGISFHLQCRQYGTTNWVQQYPVLTLPTMTLSYTPAITATGRFIMATSDPFYQCRVGAFIVTSDDGNDLTTNAEQVSLTLIGRP